MPLRVPPFVVAASVSVSDTAIPTPCVDPVFLRLYNINSTIGKGMRINLREPVRRVHRPAAF